MTRDELRAVWSARQMECVRLAAHVDGAKVIAAFLEDFDSVTVAEGEEALSLTEAARISGYSTDHLARLLREGKIPNSGQKHRPRINRKDLPEKRNFSLATASDSRYDPAADARSLRSRR